jgi:hypothetical protein
MPKHGDAASNLKTDLDMPRDDGGNQSSPALGLEPQPIAAAPEPLQAKLVPALRRHMSRAYLVPTR